jgi:hypothetical protein
VEPAELLAAESLPLKIPSTDHADGADQLEETFLREGRHADRVSQNVGTYQQVPTFGDIL